MSGPLYSLEFFLTPTFKDCPIKIISVELLLCIVYLFMLVFLCDFRLLSAHFNDLMKQLQVAVLTTSEPEQAEQA